MVGVQWMGCAHDEDRPLVWSRQMEGSEGQRIRGREKGGGKERAEVGEGGRWDREWKGRGE